MDRLKSEYFYIYFFFKIYTMGLSMNEIEVLCQKLQFSISSEEYLTVNEIRTLLMKPEYQDFREKIISYVEYSAEESFINQKHLDEVRGFILVCERFDNLTNISNERKKGLLKEFDEAFNEYFKVLLKRKTSIQEFQFISKVSKEFLEMLQRCNLFSTDDLMEVSDEKELRLALRLFEFVWDEYFGEIDNPSDDIEEFKIKEIDSIYDIFDLIQEFKDRNLSSDNFWLDETIDYLKLLVEEMMIEINE